MGETWYLVNIIIGLIKLQNKVKKIWFTFDPILWRNPHICKSGDQGGLSPTLPRICSVWGISFGKVLKPVLYFYHVV